MKKQMIHDFLAADTGAGAHNGVVLVGRSCRVDEPSDDGTGGSIKGKDPSKGQITTGVIDPSEILREGTRTVLERWRSFSVQCVSHEPVAALSSPGGKGIMLWLIGGLVPTHITRDAMSVMRSPGVGRLVFWDTEFNEQKRLWSSVSGFRGYVTKLCRVPLLVEFLVDVATADSSFLTHGRDLRNATDSSLPTVPPEQHPTKREMQVLVLVAQGCTAGEMAKRLGITKSTVENHKWKLMKKLGAKKNIQLVSFAKSLGLLDKQL